MALFLASPLADYVTGEVFGINRGTSASRAYLPLSTPKSGWAVRRSLPPSALFRSQPIRTSPMSRSRTMISTNASSTKIVETALMVGSKLYSV